MTLTAEQTTRYILTGNPYTSPVFPHEGGTVIRWITDGNLPDLHVTFHTRGDEIEVRCSTCHEQLGSFPADYGAETAEHLAEMRRAGHPHQ